jgi:hypothetical protein
MQPVQPALPLIALVLLVASPDDDASLTEQSPAQPAATCPGCEVLQASCSAGRGRPGVRALGEVRNVVCVGDDVVGVFAPVDHDIGPRSGVEILSRATGSGTRDASLRVVIDGDLIAVHQVTCGACRRVMGWSLLAEPANLPADLLSALQEHTGLPRSPLLRTTAAWQRAL